MSEPARQSQARSALVMKVIRCYQMLSGIKLVGSGSVYWSITMNNTKVYKPINKPLLIRVHSGSSVVDKMFLAGL